MKFAKHNSFVDEDEIRLYYETETICDTLDLIQSINTDLKTDIDFKSSFNQLIDILKIREKHFMMSRSGIRSYHNLCLEEVWGSGVIPEIVLGPMCIQNRKELESFLCSNGLSDTKVRVSKVPIR